MDANAKNGQSLVMRLARASQDRPPTQASTGLEWATYLDGRL